MKKTILIVLGVVIVSSILIICDLLFTKRVTMDRIEDCYYHYQYFDQDGNVRNDVVPIRAEDCATIVDMLSGLRYCKAFDIEYGFTEDYSLEFRQQNDKSVIILLQYGQHGLLRLNNTTFDHELDSDTAEQLYTLLKEYHQSERVLVAG